MRERERERERQRERDRKTERQRDRRTERERERETVSLSTVRLRYLTVEVLSKVRGAALQQHRQVCVCVTRLGVDVLRLRRLF